MGQISSILQMSWTLSLGKILHLTYKLNQFIRIHTSSENTDSNLVFAMEFTTTKNAYETDVANFISLKFTHIRDSSSSRARPPQVGP